MKWFFNKVKSQDVGVPRKLSEQEEMDSMMMKHFGKTKEEWINMKNREKRFYSEFEEKKKSELESGVCTHRFINKWVDGFNFVCRKCGLKKLGTVCGGWHDL